MTKVEALKLLYTVLGGSEDISNMQTVCDVLNGNIKAGVEILGVIGTYSGE